MSASIPELRNNFKMKADQLGLDCQCTMDGSLWSEIAIVGEAPGDHEVMKKIPMCGGSGAKLWEILRPYNINRTNVYTTNVVKHPVVINAGTKKTISNNELDHWTHLLHWELSQMPNLKYVVVLGSIALKAITGKSGITNWRGSVLDVRLGPKEIPVQVLASYNPAVVLRDPKLEVVFRMDMNRLSKLVKGDWDVAPFDVIMEPVYSQVREYIRHLQDGNSKIAYDIEVHSNETACIGLAESRHKAMCIAFWDGTRPYYSVKEERQIRRDLQHLFHDEGSRFAAQNNSFDSVWLWYKDRIRVPGIWQDTMLAHHCLYPQLPHNLGFLTTQYTSRPYYKDDGKIWLKTGDFKAEWKYNGEDCCNTHWVAECLDRELHDQGLADFFYSHIMAAQHHLIRMTAGGVKVDMELKANLSDMLSKEIFQLQEQFQQNVFDVVGDHEYRPNPASPKQLSELFFDKLKLVGKGVSTDQENRDRMFAHPATTEPKRKIISAINVLAKEKKFFGTYVDSGVDDDGRFRSEYSQVGVQRAPGRLSSRGLLWTNSQGQQVGGNLQNQPARAYEMYIADEGYGLGYFDLAQVEARLVAWFAHIPSWIEQFERARVDGKYDAHRALAQMMFSMDYDDIPSFDHYDTSQGHPPPEGVSEYTPTVRFMAKRCRHGLNYRMQAPRLAQTAGVSMSEAYRLYRLYHAVTPELQKWWQAIEKEVRDNKQLFNAFGRRFRMMERISPESMESLVAFKPQSSAGDHIIRVMYQSEDDPRWPHNSRIWMNIHDALIVLAPLDKVELCLSIMKKYAEQPIYIRPDINPPLIVPADTKIAVPDDKGIIRWSTMKKHHVEAAS